MKFCILALAVTMFIPGLAVAQNSAVDRAIQRQNGAYGAPPVQGKTTAPPGLGYGRSNINPLTGKPRRAAPDDAFTTGDYFGQKPAGTD